MVINTYDYQPCPPPILFLKKSRSLWVAHCVYIPVRSPTPLFSPTSEAQLEVQNKELEVRWYLSSFAPPYVKVLFFLH